MNEKLDEIIEYLKLGEGYDKKLVITDILGEIKSIKKYSADEVGLEWADEYLTDLDSFANDFYNEVMEKVCNILESFKED